MAFRPCLVVPCYNHSRQLRDTLAALAATGLPCLLVDDGSDSDNARALEALADEHDWLELARLQRNRGKGVAVIHGMRLAASRGYTHALQIDADGQHDPADIPALLEAARAEPEALISGRPRYGDDIPRARLYGRYLTHAMVWLQTLSFSIKDSMCGFRVYPLAPTLALLERSRVGRRMDFDTEIMVRLYWQGTPVRFVDTRVVYPPGGVSHFAVLADNLRITAMHTRLVLGMLWRLPRLLRGRHDVQHWSHQPERGSWWALWLVFQIYRLLGSRVIKLLLYPMIGYFFLTNREARQTSRDFLQRVHEQGGALPRAPDNRLVYRHLYSFGDAIVDRLACWQGRLRHEHMRFHNQRLLLDQRDSGQGAVILTSHLGNMEMTRGLMTDIEFIKLNALVYTRNAAHINDIIRRNNPRAGSDIIDIAHFGPQTALVLDEKIRRAEFIAIAADRTPPGQQSRLMPARFLGEEALFPAGPFIVASLLHCPVYFMSCIKHDDGIYDIEVKPFAERINLSRARREADLAGWIQQYADELQQLALRAPLQWFNFYDFWAGTGHEEAPEP